MAVEFVTQLGIDLQDDSCPPEIRRLGRTITKWRHQIAAWHQARFTNGPTEAVNNLIKIYSRRQKWREMEKLLAEAQALFPKDLTYHMEEGVKRLYCADCVAKMRRVRACLFENRRELIARNRAGLFEVDLDAPVRSFGVTAGRGVFRGNDDRFHAHPPARTRDTSGSLAAPQDQYFLEHVRSIAIGSPESSRGPA